MDGVVKDIKIAVPSKNLCLELPSIMNSIGSYRYVVTSKKKKKKKKDAIITQRFQKIHFLEWIYMRNTRARIPLLFKFFA